MPKLIKVSDAGTDEYCSYRRDALEPTIMASAEEVPVVDPQQEREAILAEAKALAEQRVREAYVEGLRRGEAAGRQQFENSLAECEQALASTAQAIKKAHEGFLESLEPQVVRLAHAIASHVLQREAQSDGDLIVRTVHRALDSLADRRRVVLRLHPKDLEAIRNHKVTLLEEFEGVESLELVPDDDVCPGGCIAESETLHADARLEAQLELALQALME